MNGDDRKKVSASCTAHTAGAPDTHIDFYRTSPNSMTAPMPPA